MRLSLQQFRKRIADSINLVAFSGERVVLERYGKGVVAIVSMEDLQALQMLESAADLGAALKARNEKGGIPLDRIENRLAKKR